MAQGVLGEGDLNEVFSSESEDEEEEVLEHCLDFQNVRN